MNSTYRLPSRSSKSSSLSDPIYHVDVAYIPNHGNENYVNSEFFRRIRARYYILDAVQINRHTLQSIMIGKEQWGKGEQRPVKKTLHSSIHFTSLSFRSLSFQHSMVKNYDNFSSIIKLISLN